MSGSGTVESETVTYTTVDGLGYDETNNQLIMKVNGADTLVPFKKGGNYILQNKTFSHKLTYEAGDAIIYSISYAYVQRASGGYVTFYCDTSDIDFSKYKTLTMKFIPVTTCNVSSAAPNHLMKFIFGLSTSTSLAISCDKLNTQSGYWSSYFDSWTELTYDKTNIQTLSIDISTITSDKYYLYIGLGSMQNTGPTNYSSVYITEITLS